MQYPKTIIELDDSFTKEKMERFIKMMNEHFDICEKEIEIFDRLNILKTVSLFVV